jgi:DNA replication protein
MGNFKGFPEGLTSLVKIPHLFFLDVLPLLNDIDDLRVTLYIFWQIERCEGPIHYLNLDSVINETYFLQFYPEKDPQEVQKLVDFSITRLFEIGIILKCSFIYKNHEEKLIFINSSRGRAAVNAINSGEWQPGSQTIPVGWLRDESSIYTLYEENIGIITPLIADAITDAELNYPENWIKEAIQIASERNKRNWKYIQAILRRWENDGRSKQKSSKDPEADRRKYVEGEYSDFVEY